jgi:hypothetical protein
MTGPQPLDDLGLKACPNCLEPMLPAGSARELLIAERTAAAGAAYWRCHVCCLTAVV